MTVAVLARLGRAWVASLCIGKSAGTAVFSTGTVRG